MSSRRSTESIPEGQRSAKVYVHVYDLSNWNGYLHGAGLGAYHSGVEIGGREYVCNAEKRRERERREDHPVLLCAVRVPRAVCRVPRAVPRAVCRDPVL